MGGFLEQVRHDVGVRIHGHGNLTMPQHLHDHSGVRIARQEDARTGMPEVVEPLTR